MWSLLFQLESPIPPDAKEAVERLHGLRAGGRRKEALAEANRLLEVNPGSEWVGRERALCLLYLDFYDFDFWKSAPQGEASEDGAFLDILLELSDMVSVGAYGLRKSHLDQLLESPSTPKPSGPGLVRKEPSSLQPTKISSSYLRRRQLARAVFPGGEAAVLETLPGPVARLFAAEAMSDRDALKQARQHLTLPFQDPVLDQVRSASLELLVAPLRCQRDWGGGNLVQRAWRLAQARCLRASSGWRKHPTARHVETSLGHIREVVQCPGEPPWCILKVLTPPYLRLVTVGLSWHQNGGQPGGPTPPREMMISVEEKDEDWAVKVLFRLARDPRLPGDQRRFLPCDDLQPFQGVIFDKPMSAPEHFANVCTEFGMICAVYLVHGSEASFANLHSSHNCRLFEELRLSGMLDVASPDRAPLALRRSTAPSAETNLHSTDSLGMFPCSPDRRVPLGPGVLWLETPATCCPIRKLEARFQLTGPVASIRLELHFANPSGRASQAFLLLPLDEGRSLSLLEIDIDQKALKVSRIQSSPEAGPPQVVLPHRLAALLQDESAEVLAIPLGMLRPGCLVKVRQILGCLHLRQISSYYSYSHSLSLMVSRALTTLALKDLEETTLAGGLNNGAEVAITAHIEALHLQPGPCASSHPCLIERSSSGDYTVTLDPARPLPERDFVVCFRFEPEDRATPWLSSSGHHFLLGVLPPRSYSSSPPPGRQLTILLESSAAGPDTNRAHHMVRQLVRDLGPKELFAVVLFGASFGAFEEGRFVEASRAEEVLSWLERPVLSQERIPFEALWARLRHIQAPEHFTHSVILLAQRAEEGHAREYQSMFEPGHPFRFFPVCFQGRADRGFLRAAARVSGGEMYRAYRNDAVAWVVERLRFETAPLQLKVVELHDRSLNFETRQLYPRVRDGMTWGLRPITVLGSHSGQGTLTVRARDLMSDDWIETPQPKAIPHDLLPVVWARAHTAELRDEAGLIPPEYSQSVLDYARKVSVELNLLDELSQVIVELPDGPRRLPSIDPRQWPRAGGSRRLFDAAERLLRRVTNRGQQPESPC